MENIYSGILNQISCVYNLTISDFATDTVTYIGATNIFNKGAIVSQVAGTNIILSCHSNKFGTTPNKFSWYEITGLNNSKITEIQKITHGDAQKRCGRQMYEEIMFYINLVGGLPVE